MAASTTGTDNRARMTRLRLFLGAALLAGCSKAAPSAAPDGAKSAASQKSEAPSTSASATAGASATATASASASAAAKGEGSAASPGEDMVVIPAGIFRMGGTGEDDSPPHQVAVARFALDRTEVTMDAYARCVAEKKCAAPKDDNPFCNVKFGDRGKHPVNCVDHHDAEAFCAFAGKRLPTEREWEYAARGGAEQRTFSWGEEPPDKTRACYMHEGGSCPVGSFAPGAFGLYDVSGNVWEWTSSWFGPYPDELATGQFKVYRGGSWSRRFPKWLHNELRNRYRPDEHSASLGIRCARSVTPIACPEGSTVSGEACALPHDAVPRATCGTGEAGVPPCPAQRPAALDTRASAEPTEPKKDVAHETPVKTRSPEFDEDCKHYPGYPVSYTWRGGTFQAREPVVASSGCKKRDIGVGWTSTCCPQ